MTVLESQEYPEVFEVTLSKPDRSATASSAEFDANLEKLLDVVKVEGTIRPTLDSAGDAVYKASQLFELFGKKHSSFQAFNYWWQKDVERISLRQDLRDAGLISRQRFGSNDVECLSLATFQAHVLIHIESEHPVIKHIIATNGYKSHENLSIRHQQRTEDHQRHIQQIYGDLIRKDPFKASDKDLIEIYKIGVRNGQIKWAKSVMHFNKIKVRMTSHDGKDKWWGLGEIAQHCGGYEHQRHALEAGKYQYPLTSDIAQILSVIAHSWSRVLVKNINPTFDYFVAKKILEKYEGNEVFTREVDKVVVIQMPTFVDKVFKVNHLLLLY